jgi:germination protein M
VSGCGTKKSENAMDIYYMNALGDGITAEAYEPKGTTAKELIDEVLVQLETEPDSVDYRRTIPEDVEVLETNLDQEALSVYFNREYSDLTGYTEVLVRAAIVKSLLQIDGVNSISFYVSDEPLQDSAGNLVGSMTEDTFMDDYGNETTSLASTKLTLYFASADGQSLVKEEQDVYYNKNVAKERLVIEYLLKGPTESDALAVIPSGTKVLNVTITDGVCYVNFDSTFLEQSGLASSDVVLYAIVDSLTELDNVNKVQILVNGGSTMPDSSLSFKLGTSYERDTSLVKRDKTMEPQG